MLNDVITQTDLYSFIGCQILFIYISMYAMKGQKKMETFYQLENVIDISAGSTNWFAKGHLSPDAAFVYQREQDATYFYINAAPQFQSFNAGNWRFLEEGARDLAKR